MTEEQCSVQTALHCLAVLTNSLSQSLTHLGENSFCAITDTRHSVSIGTSLQPHPVTLVNT